VLLRYLALLAVAAKSMEGHDRSSLKRWKSLASA
jgi:hypothetical protein